MECQIQKFNGKLMKCQILTIFVIAEIHKIDLEAILFQIAKIPNIKNLELE